MKRVTHVTRESSSYIIPYWLHDYDYDYDTYTLSHKVCVT